MRCTSAASRSTCARSCWSAAVTCSASRWPSVSTAACTFDPLRRLAPSYPARAPDSGVELQRAAVEDHRGGLGVAPCKLAQQRAQIFDDDLEAASPNPALRLLINHRPRRQIVRHDAPLVARANNIAKPVEYRPQGVLALRRVFPAQHQIRNHKRPLLIAYIARIISLPLLPHPAMLNRKYCPAKNLLWCKVHNRL